MSAIESAFTLAAAGRLPSHAAIIPTAAKDIATATVAKVYDSIRQASEAVALKGVQKNQLNRQGEGFKFRGIDDILNAMNTALCGSNLVVIPRVLTIDKSERTTRGGAVLYLTQVAVEYRIISTLDGSSVFCAISGEAFDSGDKSLPKAMSAAYKTFAIQTFCIPTVGSEDADFSTHEVAAVAEVAGGRVTDDGVKDDDETSGDEISIQAIKECESLDELNSVYKILATPISRKVMDALSERKKKILLYRQN